MNELTLAQRLIFVAAPLLITQATWIFVDAGKRGENKWLWGFIGLINCPSSLLVYLLAIRWRRVKCKHCKELVSVSCSVCPKCGATLKRLCPKCSRPVEESWDFCPHCSRKLKEE